MSPMVSICFMRCNCQLTIRLALQAFLHRVEPQEAAVTGLNDANEGGSRWVKVPWSTSERSIYCGMHIAAQVDA